MKSLILLIKGFILGATNLIPGVSGGTMAITLGIYNQLIKIISHITKNIKKNLAFLIPIGIGMVLAILTLSKAISYSLEHFLFATILFFIGAILGGTPMLLNKVKGKKVRLSYILIFILTFSFVIALTLIAGDNEVSLEALNIFGYIKIFLVGVVAAATMVIPGISGSAMMMTLGYYGPILGVVKDLTNFSNLGHNLSIIIPFGLGVVIGILLIAKLIEYLLKKYETKTYYAILGFVFSSVISIIIQNFFMGEDVTVPIIEFIIGVILFIAGFIIAYKLGDK